MNDVTDRDLIGKHVLNLNVYSHASGGYNDTNWPTEWSDISGLIRIPDASEGKYYDVCIDGVELKETLNSAKEYESVGTDKRHSNAYTDAIKDSRNTTTLKAHRFHLNILTHENIQFVRHGHLVRFFIDNDTVDAEKNKVIKLPKIEIKERGDTEGTCTKVFDDLCIYLKDLESKMQLDLQYENKKIRTGTTFGDTATDAAGLRLDDTSGVVVSRWNQVCVPVSLTGLLEKCETFTLETLNDIFNGTNVNIATNDVSRTISDLSNDLTSKPKQVPQQCADEKFVLQYKNNDIGSVGTWKSVEGVTFKYACHNKNPPAASVNAAFNSSGLVDVAADPQVLGKYSKSSNIEGMPSFRICLPTQGKIVNYANSMYNTNSNTPFESVLRTVDIKLKFGSASTSELSLTQKVSLIVNDDDYQPGIKSIAYSYDKDTIKNTPEAEKLFAAQDSNSLQVNPVAIFGTMAGSDDQEAVPDYSKLVKCEFDASDLSDMSNTVKKVTYLENLHGINHPVAEIQFSNFKDAQGNYAASAEIAHTFNHYKDEEEYQKSKLFGVKYTNTDAVRYGADVPRVIPLNTNYELLMLDNNTRALLIRKTPFNYENWIGSADDETIIDGQDLWDAGSKKPVPELVSVRINYRKPDDTTSQLFVNTPEHKTIHFIVCPDDRKELRWKDNLTFNFDVAEGEGKLDITPLLSATLHGQSSDQIKYFVRGVVLTNGDVSFHEDLSENGKTTADSSANLNKIIGNAAAKTFNASDLEDQNLRIDLDANNQAVTNLSDETSTDLNTKVVDGKLTLYHKNYNKNMPNQMFDAYERKYYGFFVEALYHNTARDQSCVESCVALVNIHVNPPKSGFYLNTGVSNAWCTNIDETTGEGDSRTADEHNTPQLIKDIILNMRHEDSLDSTDKITKNSGADLSDGFKINICDYDEALELIHINDNILDSRFRLKDIDSNKTTETAIAPSMKLAKHTHYNYERQNKYKIEIELCLDTLVELPVSKCSENYVCGIGTIQDTTALTALTLNKTCSFLADLSTNTTIKATLRAGQLDDTKLYYFKNPETHKYEGPFSTKPHTFDQLTAKKSLFGLKELNYAYVRVRTGDNTGVDDSEDFTALYKTPEFKDNMDKAPKPTDCTKQVFEICIQNGLDKPQSCPQAYQLRDKECHDYCTANPTEELVLDSDEIFVDAGEQEIAYVFAQHSDFYKLADMSDFDDEAKVPDWYTGGPASGSAITGIQRTIHYPLQLNNTNHGDQYSDEKDGSANGSVRFGKFDERASSNIVPLAFFVEFHDGCIDSSGSRETSVSNYIGQRVDYSGTVPRYGYTDGNNTTKSLIAKSDRDMFELINIKRNRHTGSSGDTAANSTNNMFTTAELKFNKDFVAEPDMVYRFSVAAVLNVHATENDVSYNKNMVDWDNTYYDNVKADAHGNANTGQKQPFQKYVYDVEQEAIVTQQYAKSKGSTQSSLNNAATEAYSDVLLVCRTHFTVCTKDGSLVVTQTN